MPTTVSSSDPVAASGRSLNGRVAAISIPALGSLIAEPLYLLVDSKIVAHIGTHELAALGLAMQILLAVVGLCVFLAYGTTTEVARAADDRARASLGVQGLWLGAATGAVVAACLVVFAGPIMDGLGGGTATSDLAARYLRISAVGVAAQLIAIAGQGWLRGKEQLGVALKARDPRPGRQRDRRGRAGVRAGRRPRRLGDRHRDRTVFHGGRDDLARAARRPDPRRVAAPEPGHAGEDVALRWLLLVRSMALSGGYLVVAASAGRISDEALGAHQVATLLL